MIKHHLSQLLVFLLLFILSIPASAGLVGGELGWRCLGNGRFVFFMKLYRDCDQSPLPFNTEIVEISTSLLPLSNTNQPISSIVLRPDSNTWINNRYGEIIPPNCQVSPSRFSCTNNDAEAMQQFFYESDPIILKGNIPPDGWTFYYNPTYKRKAMANLVDSLPFYLRATMYAGSLDPATGNCFDSSPEFILNADKLFCGGRELTTNFGALDEDLDSLSFHFDSTLAADPDIGNANRVFKTGYNNQSPTPDGTVFPGNGSIIIDPISGSITQRLMSYDTINPEYHVVVRIDSWRGGAKLASVFREIPFHFYNCDTLWNGILNRAPITTFNGDTTSLYDLDAAVGSYIHIPIQVIDSGFNGTNYQDLLLLPFGFLMSRDIATQDFCFYDAGPGLSERCAILRNQNPVFNNIAEPPRYELNNNANISTHFEWQTNCTNLLQKQGGKRSEHTASFVFSTYDDACPLPQKNIATLRVKLIDGKVREPHPIGMSVNLDGSVSLQWVPPIDSAKAFDYYILESSQPLYNSTPVNSIVLDSNLTKFESDSKYNQLSIFNLDSLNQPDILNPRVDVDTYFRMRTVSGCYDDLRSDYSDFMPLIRLKAEGLGDTLNGYRSRVRLSWNKTTLDFIANTENIIARSERKYYLWQTNQLGNLRDSSSWTLVDSTLGGQFELQAENCNGYMVYRLEARDTIKYLPQGIATLDSSATLTFRTYSLLDSIYLKQVESRIESVAFDSLVSVSLADQYQWIDCDRGLPIIGADSKSFIPQSPGQYRLAIAALNCKDTSRCFDVDTINTNLIIPSNELLIAEATGYRYQWLDCRADTIIPGETTQQLQLKDTGYYAVVIKAYGFSDTSACIPMLRVGLNNLGNQMAKVQIHPNPSDGLVFVDGLDQSMDYQIFNIQGMLMNRGRVDTNQNQLELPEAEGLYFVSFKDAEGNEKTFKLVKQ